MSCSWIGAIGLVAVGAAHADAGSLGFLYVAGGASIPVADSNWSDSVAVGPSLKAGAGLYRTIGVMATVDVGDMLIRHNETIYPLGTVDNRLYRLRVLAHGVLEVPQAFDPKLALTFHAGVGFDRVYQRFARFIAYNKFEYEATYTGLALEVGASAWYDLATGIDLGVELSVPISDHSAVKEPGTPVGFNYTSFDLELLAGIRFTSTD